MKTWYSKNVGDGMMACVPLGRIEDTLTLICEKAGYPDNMAAYTRNDSDGSLHCEVYVYFSPSLVSMAKELGATPCSRPTSGGLSLLAGSEASWSVLFPEP